MDSKSFVKEKLAEDRQIHMYKFLISY